jgi:MbtH protein
LTPFRAITKSAQSRNQNFQRRLGINDETDDATVYAVVINDEEQYSIWPSHKALPRGWRAVGKQGSKADCLKYIDEVWADMRPASLRRTPAKPSSKNEPR